MKKVYQVVIVDYDLYGNYGLYESKKDAKKRMKELKDDPDFLWKEYLQIDEKELVESSS